jgi:hypothetical protein
MRRAWIIVGAAGLVGVFLVLKGIEQGLENRAPTPASGGPVPVAPQVETGGGGGGGGGLENRPAGTSGGVVMPSLPPLPQVPQTPGCSASYDTIMLSLPKLDMGMYNNMIPDLVAVQACRAAATGAVAPCDSLESISAFEGTGAEKCRLIAEYGLMHLAMAKGDEAAALNYCLKNPGVKAFGPGNEAKVCRIFVQNARKPESAELCGQLADLASSKYREQTEKQCLAKIGQPEGDCGGEKTAYAKLYCSNTSNLKTAARAGGKTELCGPNATCRALFSHDIAECAPLEAALANAYCEGSKRTHESVVMGLEDAFRKENRLPKWKAGDPYYTQLPPEERMKFEKHHKGAPKGEGEEENE